jgi:hypothetical protein
MKCHPATKDLQGSAMYTDSQYEANQVIQTELSDKERLLWSGRPKQGISFTPFDVILIPLGLFFAFGFTFKHSVSSLVNFIMNFGQVGTGNTFDVFSLVFSLLFMIPFLLIGLNISVWRLIRTMQWKRGAYYGITDQRVIIVSNYKGRSVNSLAIGRGLVIKKYIRKDGSGWLNFSAPTSTAADMPPGLAFASGRMMQNLTAFVDVPDAASVAGLVEAAINEPATAPIPADTKQTDDSETETQAAPAQVDYTQLGGTEPETPLPAAAEWRTRSLSTLGKTRLVFGNAGSIFGWIWFGFSMIFFWLFAVDADYSPLYLWSGAERTTGRIVAVTDTGWKQGESDSGTPIIAYEYTYTTPDGHTYKKVYKAVGFDAKEGDNVPIEYWRYWPVLSHIAMASSGGFPWFVGPFVSLFLLIGLALIIASIRGGQATIRLLQSGQAAYATLKSQTRIQGSEHDRYKLTFEFVGRDGQTYTVESTVSNPEDSALTDQRRELVLYQPDDPSKAQLLDEITGNPVIDDNGLIQLSNTWVGILGIMLALIVIGIHGAVGWMKWGR